MADTMLDGWTDKGLAWLDACAPAGAAFGRWFMDDELLRLGGPRQVYSGLLGSSFPPRPTPPGTMTRQRRRAEARAAAKGPATPLS